MANEQTRDAQAIIEAAERYHGVKFEKPIGDDGPVLAVVPKGMEVKSIKLLLAEYLEVPERKSGTTMLTSQQSFCDFVNRHRTTDSIIFLNDANPEKPQIAAIFNPHKGEVVSKGDVGPDWQDHRAIYNFPLSDEWKVWTALPDSFTQAQFAHFLEDHITDVAVAGTRVEEFAQEIGVALATPAKLLELSRGLAVSSEMKAHQQVNTSSGEGVLVFSEEHKDSTGAPLKIPGAFALDIPVFRLGARFQVPVRLRYRLSGGRVSWILTPQRLEKALEIALLDAEELVKAKTDLPVFRGAP